MLKRTLGASLAVAAMVFAISLPQPLRAAGATQLDIPLGAFSVLNPCNGEIIAFDAGSIHLVLKADVKNDIAHIDSHFNGGQSGVGASGATYKSIINTNSTQNIHVADGFGEATSSLDQRFIGQGSGNNFSITQFIHITINANGDVTSFKAEPQTVTCSNG